MTAGAFLFPFPMALTRRTPLRARKRPVGGRSPLKRGKPLKPLGEGRRKRRKRYAEFLRSPEWKAQRQRVIARDGGRCTQCGSSERLQAHHSRYGSPLSATPDDWLTTLCQRCHEALEYELRPWNRQRVG